MNNAEKYKEQIVKVLLETGHNIAVNKETDEPMSCAGRNCTNCKFFYYDNYTCYKARAEWLNAEWLNPNDKIRKNLELAREITKDYSRFCCSQKDCKNCIYYDKEIECSISYAVNYLKAKEEAENE